MKVLYNWLKEFVELTAAPEELRTRLSLSGTAVEALEQTAAGPMLDAELTSNRADCLGHYGIAREAAVLYGLPLKRVDPRPRESSEQVAAATRVQIDSPELCGRYTARVLRGVKVGPSPDWLRQRLEALGQASINNVVDATNYVMLELGHPLHAFDMDLLAEKRIVVRRARAGEKMRTLDGIERALTSEMCVIADATRAVAIAGVMGGGDSEIRSSSRNILLESAWFDPISIRRTSKALGLRTEASMRFERGADMEMAETASRRCAELIQQVGRRRSARRRGGRLSWPRRGAGDRVDAQRISASDGCGRSRRGNRSDSHGLRFRAGAFGCGAGHCGIARSRVEVPAAVLARRRVARSGPRRRSRANLWRRQISRAPARRKTPRRASRIRRSRRSPARNSDRPRLSGDHHDSDCGRTERRDVPRGRRRARAHRESSRRRRIRDALDWRSDHGANPGMESESRSTQRAPV